jgi:hypothetical protein
MAAGKSAKLHRRHFMAENGSVSLSIFSGNVGITAVDKFNPNRRIGRIALESTDCALIVNVSYFDNTTSESKRYVMAIS